MPCVHTPFCTCAHVCFGPNGTCATPGDVHHGAVWGQPSLLQPQSQDLVGGIWPCAVPLSSSRGRPESWTLQTQQERRSAPPPPGPWREERGCAGRVGPQSSEQRGGAWPAEGRGLFLRLWFQGAGTEEGQVLSEVAPGGHPRG